MAIGGDRRWVADIRNRFEDTNPSAETERWRKQSIYRVPSCIKDLDPKAYKPQVVSFGPFHHGAPHLQPMEEHKHRALIHFLRRRPTNAPFELDDLAAAVYEVVQPLQDAYQKLDGEFGFGAAAMNKDRFVELMIVDGCFMLEVIRVTAGRSGDYAPNDPIFSKHGVLYTVPYIRRDMLMLENQLPLLVLEKLIAVETGKPMNEDLINRLVLKFLSPTSRLLATGLGLHLHPLDVFRKSMLQSPPRRVGVVSRRPTNFESPASSSSSSSSSEIIRSAVELYEAGIRFRKSKSENLHDIHFKRGVLSLPVIVVDDSTAYMFLNLMAFERLHVGAGNEVTSYVFFMDNIIDSAKDVSLLNSKGIIQNAIGSDKAVAKLFNALSKDVVLDPESSLDDVHRMVTDYCRIPWNVWRANLIHTYFRSPWAFLSLAAAVFLLVMTIMQTIYTVMPYYQTTKPS